MDPEPQGTTVTVIARLEEWIQRNTADNPWASTEFRKGLDEVQLNLQSVIAEVHQINLQPGDQVTQDALVQVQARFTDTMRSLESLQMTLRVEMRSNDVAMRNAIEQVRDIVNNAG